MEQSLLKTKWTLALALIAAAFAATALAQKPDAKGGVVVTSEPGRVAAVACRGDLRPGRRHRQGDAHGDAEGPARQRRGCRRGRRGQELRSDQGRRLRRRALRRGGHARAEEERGRRVDAAVSADAATRSPASGRQAPARVKSPRLPLSLPSTEEEHDHAQGAQGQRRDAPRAEPRSVQGRQGGRPGRGDVHRSSRAERSSRRPRRRRRRKSEREKIGRFPCFPS